MTLYLTTQKFKLLYNKKLIKIKYDETKKTINLHNKFPIMKQ